MKKQKRIFKSVTLDYPPEVVWESLTDPHALAEWLMPNDFAPELGHEFSFRTDPTWGCGDGITHCKVIGLEPQRRLTLSWSHSPDTPTFRVEFSLTPLGEERTRLTLEQTGLEGHQLRIRFLMNIGWGYMLKRLLPKVAANVRTGPSGARFEPGAIPLSKRTYKTKTVPDTHTF